VRISNAWFGYVWCGEVMLGWVMGCYVSLGCQVGLEYVR